MTLRLADIENPAHPLRVLGQGGSNLALLQNIPKPGMLGCFCPVAVTAVARRQSFDAAIFFLPVDLDSDNINAYKTFSFSGALQYEDGGVMAPLRRYEFGRHGTVLWAYDSETKAWVRGGAGGVDTLKRWGNYQNPEDEEGNTLPWPAGVCDPENYTEVPELGNEWTALPSVTGWRSLGQSHPFEKTGELETKIGFFSGVMLCENTAQATVSDPAGYGDLTGPAGAALANSDFWENGTVSSTQSLSSLGEGHQLLIATSSPESMQSNRAARLTVGAYLLDVPYVIQGETLQYLVEWKEVTRQNRPGGWRRTSSSASHVTLGPSGTSYNATLTEQLAEPYYDRFGTFAHGAWQWDSIGWSTVDWAGDAPLPWSGRGRASLLRWRSTDGRRYRITYQVLTFDEDIDGNFTSTVVADGVVTTGPENNGEYTPPVEITGVQIGFTWEDPALNVSIEVLNEDDEWEPYIGNAALLQAKSRHGTIWGFGPYQATGDPEDRWRVETITSEAESTAAATTDLNPVGVSGSGIYQTRREWIDGVLQPLEILQAGAEVNGISYTPAGHFSPGGSTTTTATQISRSASPGTISPVALIGRSIADPRGAVVSSAEKSAVTTVDASAQTNRTQRYTVMPATAGTSVYVEAILSSAVCP